MSVMNVDKPSVEVLTLTDITEFTLGRNPMSVTSGKAFYLSSYLTELQRIHNKEELYVCSKCGKSFKQRSGLFQQQQKKPHN